MKKLTSLLLSASLAFAPLAAGAHPVSTSSTDGVLIAATKKTVKKAVKKTKSPSSAKAVKSKSSSSKKSVKAKSSKSASSTKSKSTVVPSTSCTIKGNISATKEKIYHVIGCPNYKQTVIDTTRGERMFCSELEAKDAGWRKALNCP